MKIPRLRARKRGKRVWYYYDCAGKPRKELPLGSDYALALKEWARLEAQENPAPSILTFKYVAEVYFREKVPKKAPRTQKDNAKELVKLLAFFNDPPAPLDLIDPIHVRQYLDWRKDAPIRANREKALFSHIWNFARSKGYTAKTNPCPGIEGYEEPGRDNYVEDDVFLAIKDASDEPTRDALDLAYLTGQRPADVLRMSELTIKDGVVPVRQGKTKKPLRITIEGELAQAIQRIRDRKAGYKVSALALIVNERGQPLKQWALRRRFDLARAKAAKDNPKLAEAILATQFRDMRAKAGTEVAEAGGVLAARKLLGHSSVRMTEQYIRNRRGEKVKPTK